jgi:hypothetical protein
MCIERFIAKGYQGAEQRDPVCVLLFSNIGSGGPIWSHSIAVACFTDASDLLEASLPTPRNIPEKCGKGHPLTPENLLMDDREGRWRCRQCARERAAAFRLRHKRAA